MSFAALRERRELVLIVVTVITAGVVGLVNPGFLASGNLRFVLLNSVMAQCRGDSRNGRCACALCCIMCYGAVSCVVVGL